MMEDDVVVAIAQVLMSEDDAPCALGYKIIEAIRSAGYVVVRADFQKALEMREASIALDGTIRMEQPG